MAQVAIAWSLSKPFMTAPIVGTTSLDKLKDLVGALRPASVLFYRWLIIVCDIDRWCSFETIRGGSQVHR